MTFRLSFWVSVFLALCCFASVAECWKRHPQTSVQPAPLQKAKEILETNKAATFRREKALKSIQWYKASTPKEKSQADKKET